MITQQQQQHIRFDPDSPDMDWEAFLEAANCDCLGCLLELERVGAVGPDWVQEIIAQQQEMLKMQTAKCPKCGQTAYVSMYEPDLAHCPSCGMYSYRELIDDGWTPLRQGTPMPTLEEAIAQRKARATRQQ